MIFLPVFGSGVSGLWGRFLGSSGASRLSVRCLLFAFVLSLCVFNEVVLASCFVYLRLIPWVSCDAFNVDWGFQFDVLTSFMSVVVLFVSLLVHLYSTEYMRQDPYLPKFMSYLSLFTSFMLCLVTADNLLQMFVGWEGVGLCSYLLINFWYTRVQANKAAIKAMVINRIGDFFIILGVIAVFFKYKALDYASLSALAYFFQYEEVSFLTFKLNFFLVVGSCIFIGAVGKSAQIGLHTWLPDAMEGPTPVSALIHAATMVTAGIFLISRVSFIFEHSKGVLSYVVSLGAITAFFASTIGLVQNDLKKVIAYSTCSQLGYMMFTSGLSGYSLGLFHLANHAFFKALLFLAAGSVIHAVNDEQDMRKMGGLKFLLPFTYSVTVTGSLALAGFPFLSGFYSKDLILEFSVGSFVNLGFFSYILGSCAAFFTSFYSMRLIYLTFLSKPSGSRRVICYAAESNFNMFFPLGCLVIPSILIGYLVKDIFVGIGTPAFFGSLFILPSNLNVFNAEFALSAFYKTLPLVLSFQGMIAAFGLFCFEYRSIFYLKMSKAGRALFCFLNRKWYFDKIYNEFVGQFFFEFGYLVSYKYVDRGVFEMIGPTGLALLVSKVSTHLTFLSSGYLYHYNLILSFSLFFILGLRYSFLDVTHDYDYNLFFIIGVMTIITFDFSKEYNKYIT